MPEAKMSPELLEAAVLNKVEAHWAASRKAILLSTLGQLLIRDGVDVKGALQGRKLADFVGAELKGKVHVVESAEVKPWIGLVPLSVDVTGDVEKYFKGPDVVVAGIELVAPVNQTIAPVQFAPALWSAFTTALAPGKARYVRFQAKIRYVDILEADAAPTSSMRVPAACINIAPGKMDAGYKQHVTQAILKWADDHGLSHESLSGRKSRRFADESHATPDNLLYQLIANLSGDELRRISLPLDVVARLLKVTK